MSAATMRAVVSRGQQALALESIPIPEPGPGDARVRIEACGLCGSDLHLYNSGFMQPGVVPGHEMTGVVDAVGPEVEDLAPGTRVAIEPFRTCGECALCRSGRQSICRQAKLLGVHGSGGFAEFAVAPARGCFVLPSTLEPQVAALAEPMAVCVHGLRRGGFAAGQRALVLGAGSLGLLSVMAARALGASEVFATARHPHQAAAAEALGATALTQDDASDAALAELGSKQDFDVVVETVGGTAETLDTAAAAVRPGGTISVLGFFLQPVRLDTLPLLMKEVTLTWSYCYDHSSDHADFAEAIQVLNQHRDDAASLITHQLSLEEIERAFELAGDKRSGVIKLQLAP